MIRSDIWFFGTVLIVMILVILKILFNLTIIPLSILNFWWVTLLPYVIIKIFFRDTKLFKWLNKKIL